MHTHVLVCAREKVAFVTAEVIAFAFIGRNWRIDKRTCTHTHVSSCVLVEGKPL